MRHKPSPESENNRRGSLLHEAVADLLADVVHSPPSAEELRRRDTLAEALNAAIRRAIRERQ